MSDTVFCPHCAATTGAQIPLPVIITPIKNGVHVESYRACPECGRTVCYDQVDEEAERPTEITGYYVEWHYNDGERASHGSREFKADEYDQAAEYRDSMARDPDCIAYLWPIEKEIRTPAECCELALHRYHMIADYDCGVFATDKRLLEDAVKELRDALDDAHDWERATAEEVLATLQMIADRDDARASGIKGDLLQIQRRLAR